MSSRYQRVVVSVPGKLILMGEHAAVYGQPALVTAVDPRARVEVERIDAGLVIDLADLGLRLETTWDEVARHAEDRRLAWERYAADPTPERFQTVGSDSPADLVRVALGELVADREGTDLPAIAVRVTSRLPIGSGFGSSASIAVAVIGAVLTLVEGEARLATVDRLALEVERRQHGSPSGVDHRTVLNGGIVLVRRHGDGELELTTLSPGIDVLSRLEVFHTGQPSETTGTVVAAVRRLRDRQPRVIDPILGRMGRWVEEFAEALRQPGDPGSRIGELMRWYEADLERLGVVPAAVVDTIRQVEALGGAAKISGAGALTGRAAGCLLVFWPGTVPSTRPPGLSTDQLQPIELGAEGLRVENRE